MGLEKEKADTKIFMDDDGFDRSSSPALSDIEKCLEKSPDRDPQKLNSHLKVSSAPSPLAPEAATHRLPLSLPHLPLARALLLLLGIRGIGSEQHSTFIPSKAIFARLCPPLPPPPSSPHFKRELTVVYACSFISGGKSFIITLQSVGNWTDGIKSNQDCIFSFVFARLLPNKPNLHIPLTEKGIITKNVCASLIQQLPFMLFNKIKRSTPFA